MNWEWVVVVPTNSFLEPLDMVDRMSDATIRSAYSQWPQYNRRLRDVVAAMTGEQLTIRPSWGFRPGVRTAGLDERIRFHDLRHTCAALLIAQGTHPRAIMERLGHSTIAVTMDVYGHLLPSLDDMLTAGLEATYRASSRSRASAEVLPLAP